MNTKARFLTITGITAAVYAVLTIAVAPLSYGLVQCRFSEILNLLVFINPVFAPGLVIGCFIANLFSQAGLPDLIFGTLGTAISVFLITKCKNRYVASLCPAVGNIVVGVMLAFVIPLPEGMTFVVFMLAAVGAVMLGEIIAVALLGNIAYIALEKNAAFMERLRNIHNTK